MDDAPVTNPHCSTPTLIIGLGNPMLGDDGVGWRVAEAVQRAFDGESPLVEVDCLAVGGLRLMERLMGYDRAILIDAITTGQSPVGSISCFMLEDFSNTTGAHFSSAHDATLQTALALGRALGARLPDEIVVVGIEMEQTFDCDEALSPAVAAAVSRAVQIVLEYIDQPVQELQWQ